MTHRCVALNMLALLAFFQEFWVFLAGIQGVGANQPHELAGHGFNVAMPHGPILWASIGLHHPDDITLIDHTD